MQHYMTWLLSEKELEVQYEHRIVENDFELKKLQRKPEYEEKKEKWEKEKASLVTRPEEEFFGKCKSAMFGWVKSFLTNFILDAELVS